MKIRNRQTESYATFTPPGSTLPCLITCEHASNRLPAPWTWSENDLRLKEMHWAWDLGAEAFSRELSTELGCTGIVTRFTRLLIDANRALDQENLFREVADGRSVELNTRLRESDKTHRIETYWRPYHEAIEGLMDQQPIDFLLSIHSFTPLYEGNPRSVEMGVLHDGSCTELARYWHDRLETLSGMDVRLNEPYTGIGGYMYAASRHAERGNCATIEMEFRQDILENPEERARLIPMFAQVVRETLAGWNRAGLRP